MVLLRYLTDRTRPKRLRHLLDIGFAVCGLLIVALLGSGVPGRLSPRPFARGIAVSPIVGSTLLLDGVLGFRTAIDRTAMRLRAGLPARILASLEVSTGLCAFVLLGAGLAVWPRSGALPPVALHQLAKCHCR